MMNINTGHLVDCFIQSVLRQHESLWLHLGGPAGVTDPMKQGVFKVSVSSLSDPAYLRQHPLLNTNNTAGISKADITPSPKLLNGET